MLLAVIPTLFLTACNTPRVTNSYDEFTGKNVCKSNQFSVNSEGMLFRRDTYLEFQTKDKENITASLINMNVSNVFFKEQPPVTEGPTIRFTVTQPGHQAVEHIFNAHSKSTQVVYLDKGAQQHKSIVLFDITTSQLKEIAESNKSLFSFKTPKGFIKGELSDSAKNNIKHFLNNCINASTRK